MQLKDRLKHKRNIHEKQHKNSNLSKENKFTSEKSIIKLISLEKDVDKHCILKRSALKVAEQIDENTSKYCQREKCL